MFVGEGDQTEVVWECINISDENVESIASQTEEILRQGKSAKKTNRSDSTKKTNQVKYLTRSRLRLPEVSSKNKSILDCPNKCGSSFFYKHTLDKHMRFVCGQPLRYKCPYCDLSSRTRNNLNVHIKFRHPNCKNYVIDTFIGKTEPPFVEDFDTSHLQHVEPTWNEEHEIKILSVSSLAKPEDIKIEYPDFKNESIIKSPSGKMKKYVCPNNCGSSYKHEYTLKAHVEFACGQQPRFKCPYCESRSKYQQNIVTHTKSLHPGMESYAIDIVTNKIHNFSRQQHSGENLIADQEDPAKNSLQNSFNLDEEESDNSEGYDDSLMEVTKVESPDELLNPMAIGDSLIAKDSRSKFICPNNCGGSFSSRSNLNSHLRIQCGQPPKLECPYCAHRFKQTSNGFTHIKNHHSSSRICLINTETGEVIKRKKDYVCDEKISSIIDLPEAPKLKRSSSGKVENTCKTCRKDFKFDHTLSRHIAEGCGQPPRFKCPYCEYQVRRLSYAFSHVLKNHPGCEVYMVDLKTGESITDSSQIKKELIEDTEEEEKPLAPNPAYASKAKKLIKSHSFGLKKKKLMCPKGCGHYFFFKLSLQKHLRYSCKRNQKGLENINSTRFKCPYCESCSGHRSSIFRHIKSRHPRHKRYVIDTKEDIVPENNGPKVLNRSQVKAQNEISKMKKGVSKIQVVSPKKLLKQYNDDPNTLDIEKTKDVEGPEIFVCPNKCGSSFEHSFNINRHLRDNCIKVRRFKCPNCNYRSQKFKLVAKHVKMSHRMCKIYAVNVFTKQHIYAEPTRRPRTLTAIKNEKMNNPATKSEPANIKSAVVEKFNSDVKITKTSGKRAKVQKRFPCPNNCGKSFHLERFVETHLRLICGQPPRFKCPYCQQICRHQGNMTIHIKHRHPGRRNYMIDLYKKKTTKEVKKKQRNQEASAKDLQEEVEQEEPNPSGSNDVDNQNAADNVTPETVLQIHLMDVPTKKKSSRSYFRRKFECPHKCGSAFLSLHKMKMHSKSICKKAPIFKCPYCPKVCKHTWNIDMHIKHRHPQYLVKNIQSGIQQVESKGQLQENDARGQNETGELMNLTEEIAGHSSNVGINTTEEVNDELGQSNHLEEDNEIEGDVEMNDNNETEDTNEVETEDAIEVKADNANEVETEDANEVEIEYVDDVEAEDANEIEDASEVETEDANEVETEDVEIEYAVEPDKSNLTSTSSKKFSCPNNCGSSYKNHNSLKIHLRLQCGQSPRFKCPYCDNCTKQTSNGYAHVKKMHPGRQIYLIDVVTKKFICGSKYQPATETLEAEENQNVRNEDDLAVEDVRNQDDLAIQDVRNRDDLAIQEAAGIEDVEAMDDSNDEPDEPILGTEEEFGTPGPATSQKSSSQEKNKPFICPNNCGSSFTHEYSLTRHVRDQCGPPRYKCPYCFYITRQPSNVYTHIKKKHPDERIYMIDTDMNQSCDEPGSPAGDDEN